MKIGAVVRCYYLIDYLDAVLRHIEADRIVVANYRYSGVPWADDRTWQIVSKLKDKRITLLRGEGIGQEEAFNLALDELRDCDYIWINDADEFITKGDRKFILDSVVGGGKDCAMTTVLDYASKDSIYEIRTHKPVVLIKNGVRCVGPRAFEYGNGTILNDIYLHHFGYVLNALDWKLGNLWWNINDCKKILNSKTSPKDVPEEIRELI